MTDKIVQGISEIDFAVERYKRILKEEEQTRSSVMDSKLKEKGHNLLSQRLKKH